MRALTNCKRTLDLYGSSYVVCIATYKGTHFFLRTSSKVLSKAVGQPCCLALTHSDFQRGIFRTTSMSSLRRKLKGKKPPEGWELIEEVIEDFEQQLKEAVNEEHEGKRKTELTWKIHRLHWEKNRFIYDLMYQRKVMSKELFEWLVREKVADGALIAKWRKPGYEILCSMLAIQKNNHNFGTTSHCRVPLRARGKQQRITPDVQTGCISCASGDGKFGGPVWWNTPLDEDDGTKLEENRTTWGQGAGPGGDAYGGEGPGPSGGGGQAGRKRPAAEVEDDDEDDMPAEVRARLEALKKSNAALD